MRGGREGVKGEPAGGRKEKRHSLGEESGLAARCGRRKEDRERKQ